MKASPHNLSGKIVSVAGRIVTIREAKTQRLMKIHVPAGDSIYTVFGGDDDVSVLAKDQVVWVWLTNCTWPNTGIPRSAYFQIYSKDPRDTPK